MTDWEIASPGIVALGAIFFVGLERLFPYDRGQKLFRAGFQLDLLLYTFVQSYVLGHVINALIRGLRSMSGNVLVHTMDNVPVVLQLVFFWVTHDLYIYWFHRFQHHSPYFWRIHEAHHSPAEVDWLSGSRSHALEILINQTIEYAPIVLLGAQPDVLFMKGALDAIWGMYIHANIDVRSGRLQYIFNGPEMHRWHHACDRRGSAANFSTKLAVWDWLFGTAYLPQGEKPRAYGLKRPIPSGYLAQHMHAFRPLKENTERPEALASSRRETA